MKRREADLQGIDNKFSVENEDATTEHPDVTAQRAEYFGSRHLDEMLELEYYLVFISAMNTGDLSYEISKIDMVGI